MLLSHSEIPPGPQQPWCNALSARGFTGRSRISKVLTQRSRQEICCQTKSAATTSATQRAVLARRTARRPNTPRDGRTTTPNRTPPMTEQSVAARKAGNRPSGPRGVDTIIIARMTTPKAKSARPAAAIRNAAILQTAVSKPGERALSVATTAIRTAMAMKKTTMASIGTSFVNVALACARVH